MTDGRCASQRLWSAPVGIGLVADRVVLEANERLCEMVGYSPDELIGQSARLLYPNDADYEYVGSEKYRQIRGTGYRDRRDALASQGRDPHRCAAEFHPARLGRSVSGRDLHGAGTSPRARQRKTSCEVSSICPWTWCVLRTSTRIPSSRSIPRLSGPLDTRKRSCGVSHFSISFIRMTSHGPERSWKRSCGRARRSSISRIDIAARMDRTAGSVGRRTPSRSEG